MESSLPTDDNKTDDGPISRESPTDSGGSCATSSVSTSEKRGTDSGHVADQELVSESSCEEEETTEEPMDEEASSDTESEGSAVTDNTLGSIAPSSQEIMLLEGSLDLGHSAGGDGRAEQAPMKWGGPNTPMVGGDTTHVVHKKQREDQKLKPPTPPPSSMNSPKQDDEPPTEVPKDAAPEFDQGDEDEVICYAKEAELKSLDLSHGVREGNKIQGPRKGHCWRHIHIDRRELFWKFIKTQFVL